MSGFSREELNNQGESVRLSIEHTLQHDSPIRLEQGDLAWKITEFRWGDEYSVLMVSGDEARTLLSTLEAQEKVRRMNPNYQRADWREYYLESVRLLKFHMSEYLGTRKDD